MFGLLDPCLAFGQGGVDLGAPDSIRSAWSWWPWAKMEFSMARASFEAPAVFGNAAGQLFFAHADGGEGFIICLAMPVKTSNSAGTAM